MPIFGPPNIDKLRGKRDVDGLMSALRHKDSGVRAEAAEVLGEIKEPRAVERLVVCCFGDDVPEVREAAAQSLVQIAPNWRELEPGRDALWTIMQPHIRALRQRSWESASDWVRAWSNAAEALGEIGDERAVEPLVEAATIDTLDLRGFSVEVGDWAKNREAIAGALHKIGGSQAVDLLAAKIKTRARSEAAWLLGELRDARAVQPLVEVLSGGFGPWSEVITALGKIGDARAVEPLLKAARRANTERSWGDWSRAIEALGLIGDPRAAGPLVAIAGRDAAVIRALKQMGALEALGDPDSFITTLRSSSYPEPERRAAIAALQESRDPRAVEALVEVALTDHIFESVRRDAEQAVTGMANPHAIGVLIAALGQRDVDNELTLEAGKRMLGELLDALVQQLSPDDLRALASLEDGERVVRCLGWEWDSYNETREWVSGTVSIEFRRERERAKKELARRGLRL